MDKEIFVVNSGPAGNLGSGFLDFLSKFTRRFGKGLDFLLEGQDLLSDFGSLAGSESFLLTLEFCKLLTESGFGLLFTSGFGRLKLGERDRLIGI